MSTTDIQNGKEAVGLAPVSNDGEATIMQGIPYIARVEITGVSAILFHRWSNEAVAEKAAAAKNSKAKKSDNIESYMYRTDDGNIGIPGEYLRRSIIMAAKYKQDPRSTRKSAMDLYQASIISLTDLADTGAKDPDYIDRRRVTVQRAGVTRERPALRAGWKVTFDLLCQSPEYISPQDLLDTITQAGRLVGMADFRPSFGRYQVTRFEVTPAA
jgi:hypothetical protein